MQEKYRQVASWLKEAKFSIALTGAGISVPSGIPDFRSPGGLWSKFDPWEVCSDYALKFNPKGVWEFLLEAVILFKKAKPNPAHFSLAKLEEKGLLRAIITQNIDGLHQLAGSKEVIEFHGGVNKFYCNLCGLEYPKEKAWQLTKQDIPWLCDKCQGVIRPDVVFFGEAIPTKALYLSQDLSRKADLIMVIGTSGEVAPANTLPSLVKAQGGKVVEINLGPTSYEGVSDLKLEVGAEIALPAILEELEKGV